MKPAAEPTIAALLLRLAQMERAMLEMRQAYELRIAALEAENAALKAENKTLKEKIARLEKDSSNSGLPPSSDIAPPEKQPKPKSGRKIGGQPGHKMHARTPFPPEQVDATITHTISKEEQSLRGLTFLRFDKHQQVELKDRPCDIVEHHRAVYRDPLGNLVFADWNNPTHVGLFGPKMKAMVASLNISCHASVRNLQQFLRDVFVLPVSTGYLCKALAQTSEAIAPAWQEAKDAAPNQKHAWMDETGHKQNGDGRKWWCWALVADTFTFFAIRASRGRQVVYEILGAAFEGVLHCDYFTAYVHIDKDGSWKIQHCIAHLLRDLQWLADHPDATVARWGAWLKTSLCHVLAWHKNGWRDDAMRMKDALLYWTTEYMTPKHVDAESMAKRLRKDGDRYFRFLWDPLAEPTNNKAERAIRPTVLHRKCTQGTRGDTGQRWWERAWTVVASCRQQERSSFQFFSQALVAQAHGLACPSLLVV
ncbi:MAG: IS66 family transposase [Terriglobales bacterium]